MHVPGFPVEDRPTGAGDCFDAGFLAAWMAGSSPVEAARYANACGAWPSPPRGRWPVPGRAGGHRLYAGTCACVIACEASLVSLGKYRFASGSGAKLSPSKRRIV